MQLIIPVRLEFKYNQYRHAGCMKDKFRNNEISLIGNVKAVISDSFEDGMKVLKADICKCMNHLLEYGVTMKDFQLVYSSDYITNGRVWASTSVVSWENFD
jgi:hypothetical protein